MKFFISSLLFALMMNLPPVYGQENYSLLTQAQQAFAEEKFSETVALLQQEEITAQSYESLLLLGDARQKNEEYTLAIEAYNRAEELNNSDAELYINRASAKIWSDQYNAAFKDLTNATALAGENYRTEYYMGVANYYKFSLKNAIKALDRCVELNPTYAPAYYLRAACLGELGKYRTAIEDYSKAYNLDSTLTIALFNIAVTKYQDRDYSGAQSDLTQLLQSDLENQAEIYYYRAECSYLLKDKQAACFDYSEAMKRGDALATEIYDKFCLKGEQRKSLPKRNTQSISL